MHPSNPNWKMTVPKFEVKPGQVVAVVGRVGAGKSSLVQAILGNMTKEHGEYTVSLPLRSSWQAVICTTRCPAAE